MINFAALGRTVAKITGLLNYIFHMLQALLLGIHQFWIELTYILFLSLVGYGALKLSMKETAQHADFDIFFMSVSATTVSSMSTMEMEVFSNLQLIFYTLLMLAGGEVFSSMIELQLLKLRSTNTPFITDSDHSNAPSFHDQIVLSKADNSRLDIENPDFGSETSSKSPDNPALRCRALRKLLYVVFCYLLVTQVAGFALIYIYVYVVTSAKQVLNKKGINLMAFSVFLATSTFTNCGFAPTNENMMAFKKNSGLLLILIPLILMGNTFYPACLRFTIWVLERTTKTDEFRYILMNSREVGYKHVFPGLHTKLLAFTAVGFIIVQWVCFCSVEWQSEATSGLGKYQKIVGSLFQVINSRHAGESAFDLSSMSAAMLFLFVLMMYLPPYTCFLPFNEESTISMTREKIQKQRKKPAILHLLLSPLCCLVVFVFLICVIEREKVRDDPINFNVFSIVLEVVSAYGNVGFSLGYNCEKQIRPNGHCKDTSYGFVGRWSKGGKLVLITVMIWGKLKKFSINGRNAWRFL